MCICSEKWLYPNKYETININETINETNINKSININKPININEKYNLFMYEPSEPIIYGLLASYLDDLNNQ